LNLLAPVAILAINRGRTEEVDVSIQISNDQTTYSAWSPWSSWQRLPGSTPIWQSCRTRTVTHTWTEREATAKETWLCPSDYVYVGGGECRYWSLVYPEGGGGTGGHPSTVAGRRGTEYTYGPPTNYSKEWTETECRQMTVYHKLDDPRPFRLVEPPPYFHTFVDLRIVQGDQIILRGGKALESVSVNNGSSIDPSRTIRTADYPTGTCLIDLSGKIGRAEPRFQFITNLVPRLRFVAREPVISRLGGSARDKLSLSARIENHSHGEELVRLEVSGVPEGWQGEIAGRPLQLLAPGKGASIRIRGRRQDEGGRMREPKLLPFTVRATAVGNKKTAAETTLYVH
jgi:hypothetical protein